MTSEQRRVQEMVARLRGEYRREGEFATKYLNRIIGTHTSRSIGGYVFVGRRVYEDYEMELTLTERYAAPDDSRFIGYCSLMFRGFRVRLNPDFDPNFAQLKEY